MKKKTSRNNAGAKKPVDLTTFFEKNIILSIEPNLRRALIKEGLAPLEFRIPKNGIDYSNNVVTILSLCENTHFDTTFDERALYTDYLNGRINYSTYCKKTFPVLIIIQKVSFNSTILNPTDKFYLGNSVVINEQFTSKKLEHYINLNDRLKSLCVKAAFSKEFDNTPKKN